VAATGAIAARSGQKQLTVMQHSALERLEKAGGAF